MRIAFQLLFALFCLGIVASVFGRQKKGELSLRGAFFWAGFWVIAAVLVFLPDATAALAQLFGIGRGVDIIIYISIATLFYVVFRLHIKLEILQRDITRVVRDRALGREKNI